MDLQTNETMYNVMDTVASNDMGIWTCEFFDGQEPRIICSDKMYEIMGFSNHKLAPEAIYKEWNSRIVPEDLQSIHDALSKIKNGAKDEITYRWNHPSLGMRYIRCGGTGTYIPGRGYKISGYHYDVTDQMVKENDKNYVLEALASTYMCLFYIDLRKGTYVSYNNTTPFINKVIPNQGWTAVAMENFAKHLAQPEFADKIREFTNLSTLDKRMLYKNRISCRFLGPHHRWAKATLIATNRDSSGKLSKAIMGFRDIDEQVRAEQQQAEQIQKSIDSVKSNTEYVQNLTHEIRTPLNAMFGFAQLLSLPDGCLSSTEREQYFHHINNSFNMLSMLIGDVLDLADATHGNYSTITETVNVNEVCKNAVEMSSTRKPVDVEMTFTSDVADTFTLQSDGRRIQQLLVNYLTNACKHTKEGKIHLHVSTTETPGRLTFSVEDTGEGVPADQAENIFKRFTKLNQAVQGSGLGLNICSIIAQKLGGIVKLDTSYTKGARFLFIL